MYYDCFKEINEDIRCRLGGKRHKSNRFKIQPHKTKHLKNKRFKIKSFGNDGLNYARFILPSKESEIAVVGKYKPDFLGKSFITLNEDLEVVTSENFSNFYYGVSPKIDNSVIIESISNLEFANEEGLTKFISKYHAMFMLHEGQNEFLLPLAKYITLSIAYNYGIKINFKNTDVIKDIISECDMDGTFLKKEDTVLTIHGCPTESLLIQLNKYTYSRSEDDVYTVCQGSEKGISIYDIYQNKENLILINGDLFYSGVLPRCLYIEENDSRHTNKDITSINIYYERSTYATVFSLDNNFSSHPLLRHDKKAIVKFFCYDDNRKIENLTKEIVDGENGKKKLIAEINEYLKYSYNVNQIVVSGNIISSDGNLIYSVRDDKAIDSGKIYPSVNGNVEIADKNVSLYIDSVDVDYPSLDINGYQNSFGAELCRESAAELNIPLNNNLLKCYGITISGTVPSCTVKDEDLNKIDDSTLYPFKKRRLHFNILYNQKIDADIKKIKQLQALATEKYENKDLFGLSVKVYEGIIDIIIKCIKYVIKCLMGMKSVITSLFSIALFILSLRDIEFASKNPIELLKNWNTSFSSVFALLVCATTVVDIIRSYKLYKWKKKYIHTMFIIKKKNVTPENLIIKPLNKILHKHKDNYHPVAYIAFKLYILNLLTKDKK